MCAMIHEENPDTQRQVSTIPKELHQLNASAVYTTHCIRTTLQWVTVMCTCGMFPCNFW